MDKENYLKLMDALNYGFDKETDLIIHWDNGMVIRATSITGEYETDADTNDEEYIGEYAATIGNIEILQQGNDNSVKIYNNCIEICLKCIPSKILLEDRTLLWKK